MISPQGLRNGEQVCTTKSEKSRAEVE